MSEAVRLYQYKSLLSPKRAISAAELMAKLEISPATLKRDLAKLRDQLHVPIRFDRDLGGYVLDKDSTDIELPGLRFSQDEILALVTIQQMLSQLEPGLLGAKLRPLQDRLAGLMEKHGLTSKDIARRVRIVHAGKRRVKARQFEAMAAATMARKRMAIWHFYRQSSATLEREVSPQRLVHYRDNWYLDAWCHLRDDLRNFSKDAIADLRVLDASAKEVTARNIDEALGAGYGIFVRWKPVHLQAIGWEPDLNDGVRMTIRPFVQAEVLRIPGRQLGIKWEPDRGKDVPSAPWFKLGPTYGEPEGTRINDHHLSLADKHAARAKVGGGKKS